MHNGEYYDNLMAYSYDDYIESKEEDAMDDYLEDRAIEDEMIEHFEPYEYESKMAEQLMDILYGVEK